MSEPHPAGPEMATPETALIQQLSHLSANMASWLKFLGIVYIFQAAILTLFTFFVGIIVAWLPLWLGILLYQAGNRGSSAFYAKNPRELVGMLEKLRLFFIINGVIIVFFLAVIIMTMIFIGGNFFSAVQHFQEIFY